MNSEIKEKHEELKKINHELDSFVHRISHDLKEPLASVLAITKVWRIRRVIHKIRKGI